MINKANKKQKTQYHTNTNNRRIRNKKQAFFTNKNSTKSEEGYFFFSFGETTLAQAKERNHESKFSLEVLFIKWDKMEFSIHFYCISDLKHVLSYSTFLLVFFAILITSTI